jgi:dTMP kinase
MDNSISEHKGVFIVLEGADGSGKGTQFKLLAERLKAVGYDISVFDFPRYDEPSSHFVRSYLNGEYGDAANISPYTASLFYALDRYEAAPQIRKALKQGKVVLSNRYVGSNMAHQGGKFTNSGEQRGFFIWEDGLEFQLLGIPRPTVNIFLRVPAEVSYELISKKEKRSYTDQSHDQHEGDMNHLRQSVATYDTLCKLFPKDFKAIECAPDGKLLSIAGINDIIWNQIKPLLPPKPPNAGRDIVVQLNEEQKENKAAKNNLDIVPEIVNTKQNKEVLTKELAIEIRKVSLLAVERVKDLAGVNCEVLNIEWGNEKPYNYFTPTGLSKKLLDRYKDSFKKLADLNKKMNEALKHSKNPIILSKSINATIPMSALATIKVTGTTSYISNLISQLRTNSLSEVRWLAEQLQTGAHRQQPDIFKLSVQSQNVLEQNDELSKIASSSLAQNISPAINLLTLEEAWPRNEFNLLVDALYPYSTSSRRDITKELEGWTYEKKSQALTAAFYAENNPILQDVRYRWSVITDSNSFRKLTHVLQIQDLQTQPLTPRYGYEVPEEIEQAAIDELFIECFDESLSLFSALQEAGYNEIAEYTTLAGHKNRWQFSTHAKAIKLALNKKSSSSTDKFFKAMMENVNERHPLIGNYLISPVKETKEAELKPTVKKEERTKKSAPRHRRRIRKPKNK